MEKAKCLAISYFIVLHFAACPPPGPGGGGPPLGNTVIITENITVPTVWESAFVRVIERYDYYTPWQPDHRGGRGRQISPDAGPVPDAGRDRRSRLFFRSREDRGWAGRPKKSIDYFGKIYFNDTL